MHPIEHLPATLTVQYSELMQNCIHPLSDGSNISFKSKSVNGKRYWYLYISLGATRREHYLGEESTALLDRIEDERDAWESNHDDRELRARLVSILIAGGMLATRREEGKLLALLERSGLFVAGGVLVGTVAFRAYANMLGVHWPGDEMTQDVDIAADRLVALALPREKNTISLRQTILDSGLGFFEVPALDRKRASTSYKIRGREFRVDVLTPMRGRDTQRPVKIEAFDTWAQPLRFLEFLLEDIQPVVLLYEHGIMTNVPSPARFAIHKCVVSQMRPAASAVKARKDLQQAEKLFQVLLKDRPGDLRLAHDAAERKGEAFLTKFRAGLDRLGKETQEAVRSVFPLARGTHSNSNP